MAWYWPFKKKTRTARDGGTVAATVTSPTEDVADHVSVAQTNPSPAPATVEQYVLDTIQRDVEQKFAPQERDALGRALAERVTDLRPVDHRFKVGDRALTVNGHLVWEVKFVADDYSSIVVTTVDTRGRAQVRRYEPYRLIRAHDGARGF